MQMFSNIFYGLINTDLFTENKNTHKSHNKLIHTDSE